ncbi:MAG: hypothetical protein EOO51_08915 [Flavobacterium sp.]|nr:MAG: hypothetical protein EOO51_08915 [Flavobacterium sp.]
MKTNLKFFLLFCPLLLMSIKCAKEDEDLYIDEDRDYQEAHYDINENVSKQMAIENWEQFLKQAHTSFLLTESNLLSLELKIEEESFDNKDVLRSLHSECSAKLKHSKENLERRNESFVNELKHYDVNSYKRNEAFMKRFRRTLFDINLEMENVLEEM